MPTRDQVKNQLARQFRERFADVFYLFDIDTRHEKNKLAMAAVEKAEAQATDGSTGALRKAFRKQVKLELEDVRNGVRSLRGTVRTVRAMSNRAAARPRYEEIRPPDQPRQFSLPKSGGPQY